MKKQDLIMQPLDIFFDSVDELGLILLDGSTDLSDRLVTRQSCGLRPHTFGRTKRALNFENTLNISLAFLAVPNRSLRRAIIWFSTLATRSLYAFSAVTQISVPSIISSISEQDV